MRAWGPHAHGSGCPTVVHAHHGSLRHRPRLECKEVALTLGLVTTPQAGQPLESPRGPSALSSAVSHTPLEHLDTCAAHRRPLRRRTASTACLWSGESAVFCVK